MRVERSTEARGVSPSDLRRINERVVLDAMVPGQAYRVTELMRTTALTRVTVTDVLRQLQDKGWITAQASSGGRGRPAQMFSRVAPGGLVAGLDIGAYELGVSVADMTGTVLARDRTTVSPGLPRSERLDRTAELLRALLVHGGHSAADLWSVLVATTGTVTGSGVISQSVAIGDWAGTDVVAELTERLGVPVEVRNDIQLFGRAEHRWGAAAGAQHALMVWLGRRPAVSLILHGQPYDGAHGTAGDLSRVGLKPSDTAWGGHGQWLPHLLPDATTAAPQGPDEDPWHTMLLAAQAGDTEARTAFEQWLTQLAPILSLFTAVIDPEVIVLGGPLVPLAADLLPILEEDLSQHLQQRPAIASSAGGKDAVADAAARSAAEGVYSALADNGGRGLAQLHPSALRRLT